MHAIACITGVIKVLTDILGMGRVAVLQRRGELNHERMAPQNYPGVYQTTVFGGVEAGEDLLQALRRELNEELGENAANTILTGRMLKKLIDSETEDMKVVIYGILAPVNFLQFVQLNASSGGIRLLWQDEIDFIVEVDTENQEYKKLGIVDRRIVAMFPSNKQAVISAFKLLC